MSSEKRIGGWDVSNISIGEEFNHQYVLVDGLCSPIRIGGWPLLTNMYWWMAFAHQYVLVDGICSPICIGGWPLLTNTYWWMVFAHQYVLVDGLCSPIRIGGWLLLTNTYWWMAFAHQYVLVDGLCSPMRTGGWLFHDNTFCLMYLHRKKLRENPIRFATFANVSVHCCIISVMIGSGPLLGKTQAIADSTPKHWGVN